MSMTTWTGLLLILLPLMFNVVFFLLQRTFDYPDILRRPPGEVLTRFHRGGRRLVGLWYAFVVAGLLFLPLAILTPQVLDSEGTLFVVSATAVGLLAGLVQILGLLRWVFVVPPLAASFVSPSPSQASREAVTVAFEVIHRYAGAAIGEHLGYLFTSLWTILVAGAMASSPLFPGWLACVGLLSAVGIFLGLFEEVGFKPAGAINAVSYVLWSIWLAAAGIALLLG